MSEGQERPPSVQPPGPEDTADESWVLPPGADQANGWPGWMGPAADQETRRRGDLRGRPPQ